MSEPIRMDVKGMMIDPASNNPIVILRDADGVVFLPIWIGVFEANAIALRLEGVEPPRPMTHDLLRSVFGELDATIERVLISDLRNGTFYAEIHVTHAGRQLTIDARPSDAIALALRCDVPVFVRPEVLELARTVHLEGEESEEEKLRKWLEESDPDDLGKYTM